MPSLNRIMYVYAFCFYGSIFSITPLNIVRPYDETFLFLPLQDSRGECNILYEKSLNVWAVQDRFMDPVIRFFPDKVNPLQIYQREQDSLGALKDFSTKNSIGQLAQAFTIDDDNDQRGHFLPYGKLSFQNAIFTGRYTTHHVSFTASLPLCQVELSHVCWKDLTKHITAEDSLAHDLLSDNLSENMEELACLTINNYKRTGLSDLYLGMTYNQTFYRSKGMLDSVGLQIQGGITLPTGKKRDPYQVLAFEFGNNGTVGTVFGGELDLAFAHYLRVGANAQFLYLFGNNSLARVKTDLAQTDLLLLQLAPVYTKWGFTQKFYLFAELYRFYQGLSFQAAYQYIRHDHDKIFACSNTIYPPLANSSFNLFEWTINTLVLKLRYEPDETLHEHCRSPRNWLPRAEIFFKKGFNGRNSFLSNSIGGHISISF